MTDAHAQDYKAIPGLSSYESTYGPTFPPTHPDPTKDSDDQFPMPTQTRSSAIQMVEDLTLSSLRSRKSAEHLIHSDPELNNTRDIAIYDMLEAIHTSLRAQNILLAIQVQAQTSTMVFPTNFIPAVTRDMKDVE